MNDRGLSGIRVAVGLLILTALVAAAGGLFAQGNDYAAPGNTRKALVLISEVAVFWPEYVELYNPTETPALLDGWTLCYYSANREDWSHYVNIRSLPTDAVIDGLSYYLIGLDISARDMYPGSTDSFAEPRVRLSTASGCVALFRGAPSDATLVDAVGWGDAGLSEGSPVQGIVEGRSLTRLHEGDGQGVLRDTDHNAYDFALALPSLSTSQVAVHLRVQEAVPELDPDGWLTYTLAVENVGVLSINCTFDARGDLDLAPEAVPASWSLPQGGQMILRVSAYLPNALAFCSLDLETTGFSPATDDITELAWARFEGGSVVQTYSTLVRPSERITQSSLEFAANWLSVNVDELLAAPALDEVLPTVIEALASQLVVVHSNNRFDERFMQSGASLIGTSPAEIRFVNTYGEARRAFPGMASYALESLAKALDLEVPTHRALPDAITAGHLFWRILEEEGVYVTVRVIVEGHGQVGAVELRVPLD